ncbi:MAG: hypothetical protein OHK0040_01330 [bacterium]
MIFLSAAFSLVLIFAYIFIDVEIRDQYFGIFVLKKASGFGIEIVNDIYPDELKRKIISLDLDPSTKSFYIRKNSKKIYPRLNYIWDKKRGRGFVFNYMAEDKVLLTVLSRFKTDTDETENGIFIGGELPGSEFKRDENEMNDTGMAYYDGTRWYHVWCTSNEGLASGTTMEPIPPVKWKFLGSDVLKYTPQTLVLKSTHQALSDGNPLLIERFGIFIAGKPFMILVQKITNISNNVASYYYVYGDEPWLGNYGTSVGNIGWVSDHLIKYEEDIDTKKYNYIGLCDYGNDVIGEKGNFTGMANFIEWIYDRPDVAFIVNQENSVINKPKKKTPLSSKLSRFIGAQWGPVYLQPKGYQVMVLAIGMAQGSKDGKIPVKPDVYFDVSAFPYF